MTSTRTVLFCIVFVIIESCADENKVVKQVHFNRNMPAWRSAVRVRQVQGSFPRLSPFYDGGSRPQLFNFHKRYNDLDDTLER